MSPYRRDVDLENSRLPMKLVFSAVLASISIATAVTVWVVTKNTTDDTQTKENAKTLAALNRLEDLLKEKTQGDELKFESEKADRERDNAERKTEIQSVEKAIKDLGQDLVRVFAESVSKSMAREWILRQRIGNPTIVWHDLPGDPVTVQLPVQIPPPK